MLPHKGADDLIRAIKLLDDEQVQLIIVGSGPERQALESLVAQLQLTDAVYFSGFANQGELAQYFAVADIFAFTSKTEPYGAVVAESLPFGLPIVASDNIGAVGQTVLADNNALVYSRNDVAGLADCLDRLIHNSELRHAMGRYSKSLVSQNDKSVLVNDIITYCHSVK